jgi:hypothetical protein
MNPFRFIADALHLLSFIILIAKIRNTRNCLGMKCLFIRIGLSYRTQELYMVVFLTRYWDLFLYFVSAYNTTMKILYILCTLYIIYIMKFKKPYCLVINILFLLKVLRSCWRWFQSLHDNLPWRSVSHPLNPHWVWTIWIKLVIFDLARIPCDSPSTTYAIQNQRCLFCNYKSIF